MRHSGIPVRRDITPVVLRKKALQEKNGRIAARILGIANVLEGMSREEAARQSGMTRQTLHDWVIRYNDKGIEGLRNAPKGHAKRALTPDQEEKLAVIVLEGPNGKHGPLVRWRRIDLCKVINQEFGVEYHERSVGKILHRLGFVHISARPLHPETDQEAQEAFKKNFSDKVAKVLPEDAKGKVIEIWFQDEARVGQKGRLVRVWARKGTRPRQLRDQRHANAYIFGAVCPARDVGAALVMPYSNTEAMNLHLIEISKTVQPGAHAVIIIDNAGWHTGYDLIVPANISLLPLPPYSPELNAQEDIWQFLRENYLSICVFETYQEIVDTCCSAWNALVAETGRIASIATRKWLAWKAS